MTLGDLWGEEAASLSDTFNIILIIGGTTRAVRVLLFAGLLPSYMLPVFPSKRVWHP